MISEFLGVPWREGGRGPNGFDCYGLVIVAAERMGVRVPDLVHDGHRPALEEVTASAAEIEPEDARPGDVLVLQSGQDPHPAIVIDAGFALHVAAPNGVQRVDVRTLQRLKGVRAWRFPNA